jgi:hypothetical protein
VHPEKLVEVADFLGQGARLGQHRQRRLWVGPPTERHAERRRRVELPAPGRRIARASDPDRLAGELVGLREGPLQHQELSQTGDDGSPGDRGGRRHEVDGTPPGGK